MRCLQRNGKEEILHIPLLQELSASEAALTFLLFRPWKEHPSDYKGSIFGKEWDVGQDSPWPWRVAVTCAVSSLTVGEGRQAETGKTHPSCRKISDQKGSFLYIMTPFFTHTRFTAQWCTILQADRCCLLRTGSEKVASVMNVWLVITLNWACVKNSLIPHNSLSTGCYWIPLVSSWESG